MYICTSTIIARRWKSHAPLPQLPSPDTLTPLLPSRQSQQTALERATSEAPVSHVILQAVLNELIQASLDRMMAFVPLPDIVRKITTDHASRYVGADIILI